MLLCSCKRGANLANSFLHLQPHNISHNTSKAPQSLGADMQRDGRIKKSLFYELCSIHGKNRSSDQSTCIWEFQVPEWKISVSLGDKFCSTLVLSLQVQDFQVPYNEIQGQKDLLRYMENLWIFLKDSPTNEYF